MAAGLLLLLLSLLAGPDPACAFDARGGQFIGLSRFGNFARTRGDKIGEQILTSPIIQARINWNELIASWDADAPEGTYLELAVRAIYPQRTTKYFIMGRWSPTPDHYPRESVPGQKDADGDVSTDTLRLSEPAESFQVRLRIGGDELLKPRLKFLGLSLKDTRTTPPPLEPDRAAWGRLLPVPERSQMVYPNGKVLCSPTTLSMLMTYWSHVLNRPELNQDVPQVAQAVYDSQWQGTGNWPFNTAYAGSYRGMRAYVTRMSDLAELEEWIAAGIPVGLSVCYDRLRGKGPGPNGHLVVCVGFTEQGDPIINDPGTTKNVRKVFPRKNLTYAWAYSGNATYLLYPQNSEIPEDRFGHWDSWTAHQRILFR